MKISDISINDTIITKDNIKGSVIQINSILYLNNIMSKKKNLPNYKLVLDNERSKDKIYNTFNNNYHNGFIEGNNYFIKVLKRIAFGFRSFRRFKARIMICKNLLHVKKASAF